MATVTGMTAAAMQAIADASIVSGTVNGSGDLILTTHGGTTQDAGHVQAPNLATASTTVPGILELAADSDAITGTDAAKAVTSHALNARINSQFRYGQISSTWSSGLAPVTLDDGVTVVNCYYAPTNPDVIPSALVKVEQIKSGLWIIDTVYAGKPTFMKKIPLALNSPTWTNYADVSGDSASTYGTPLYNFANTDGNTPINASMSTTGIVNIEGLVVGSGATAGSIIATLPVGMRPARAQVFPVNSNAAYGAIYITTDGAIRYLSGSLLTPCLSNITFRASGYGTWVPFTTMLSSWVEYTTAIGTGDAGGTGTHTPGYTIDTDGVVIFEGMISGGTSSSNIYACTLLTNNALTEIYAQAAAGSTGNVSIRFGGNIAASQAGTGNTLTIGTAGTWNSLAGFVVWPTGTWESPRLYNSWVQYNAGYSTAQVAKTPDGFVMWRGLVATGTVGGTTPIMLMSQGWRPRYQIEGICQSNGAFGVLNAGITWTTSLGYLNMFRSAGALGSGSNSWVSLSNMHYAAAA